MRRMDKLRDGCARALIRFGRPLRQPVDPAVHVRVGRAVIIGFGFDDLKRLLRGRRVVEIDERLAVWMRVENRKIPAPYAHQVFAFEIDAFHHASPASAGASAIRVNNVASRRAFNESIATRSITSRANAKVSSARAARSSMPRARR